MSPKVECRECGVEMYHKMGCGSKALPLLNSERREYEDRIKSLRGEVDSIHTMTLHIVTRIINTSPLLSEETKSNLLEEIWK